MVNKENYGCHLDCKWMSI